MPPVRQARPLYHWLASVKYTAKTERCNLLIFTFDIEKYFFLKILVGYMTISCVAFKFAVMAIDQEEGRGLFYRFKYRSLQYDPKYFLSYLQFNIQSIII